MIQMPIFALNDINDAQSAAGWLGAYDVLEAARKNKASGGKYPQWGAQLNDFMFTSGNAETCIRRGI